MKPQIKAMIFAVLAAALYALNAPFSKLLMGDATPTMLAGLLYLGAGVGMGALMLCKKAARVPSRQPMLKKKDLPFVAGMVVLDIAAPILLMLGLAETTAENASLLNNFEIVATTVIAFSVFRERVSPRLWAAVGLVVVASFILTFEGGESLSFNRGSLLILGACACWGLENNCTRSISHKSSEQIVLIKGIFSGAASVCIALLSGEAFPALAITAGALLLGFTAYGLSIYFYISAQYRLGAAKTGAFYAVAPFLGVLFSFALFREPPTASFYAALAVMLAGTAFMVWDTLDEG